MMHEEDGNNAAPAPEPAHHEFSFHGSPLRRQTMNEYREEQNAGVSISLMRKMIGLLTQIKDNQETIIDQNKQLISIVQTRNRSTPPNTPPTDALFFVPLMQADAIFADPRWDKKIYHDGADAMQRLFSEFTVEMARSCVYGDDVLKKSNVSQPAKGVPRLDPRGLSMIAEKLKQKLATYGYQLSLDDWNIKWGKAQTSLQKKIQNLRSGACMTMTSSELAQMSSSDLQ